jgi:hypothetical protein
LVFILLLLSLHMDSYVYILSDKKSSILHSIIDLFRRKFSLIECLLGLLVFISL